MTLPVKLRRATEADLPFIYHSWLKSFRGDSTKHVPAPIFYENQKRICKRLLESCELILTVDKEFPEQIYAYLVAETIGELDIIHYAFTKQCFRRYKLFSRMLESFRQKPDLAYSHETLIFYRHLAPKLGAIYNPYILQGEFYHETKPGAFR